MRNRTIYSLHWGFCNTYALVLLIRSSGQMDIFKNLSGRVKMRSRHAKRPLNMFAIFGWLALISMTIFCSYFLDRGKNNVDASVVLRSHCIITIVIPLYNKQKYINRALDSAIRQNVTNLDILVIDDGSKDDGPKIVLNYTKMDPRVRLLRLPRNRGTHFVRISGVMNAYGEYIMSLDPDDELFPEAAWIAQQAIQARHPDIVEFKIMQWKYVREKRRRKAEMKLVPYGYAKPLSEFMNQHMLIRDYIGLNFNWNLPRKCIRATVYSKALSLLTPSEANARIIFAEDKLQVGLIVLTARSLVYVKQPGYIYHTYLTDNSKSMAYSSKKEEYIDRDLVLVNTILTRVFKNKKGIVYDPKGH